MGWENDNLETGLKYISFCEKACVDEALRQHFKVHPHYTPILSHVSPTEGELYLELALSGLDRSNMQKFLDLNDAVGGAPTTRYLKINREADPTSLRYLKFVSDIKRLLGSKHGSVLEIGGGYGGLYLCASMFLDIGSYLVKDHKSVIPFIEGYLQNFNLSLSEDKDTFDTVLSTYAWDELDFEDREQYLTKYFLSSKKGYLVANDKKIDQHSWPEDITRIPDQISPNYSIIYWNRN